MDIGAKIRRIRERAEVPACVLAQRAHISPSYLCDIEHGRRRATCDVVACISRVLGRSDLLEDCLLECPVYREWVRHRDVRKVA
ncbi:MAG: helix-turn-helix transcriptional regulator [Clostridia bacterium]|nr:helix-turn-helix transcriptional regulator [Clostridia bacterium]